MEQREAFGQGVDSIDDVIQLADQRVNIFAIEWRNERAIQPLQRLMGKLVGGVLLLANALNGGGDVREALRQLPQVLGHLHGMARHPLEKVEKDSIPRQE